MIKVAIDAMGGDFAPKEQIKGTIEALKKDKELFAVLCGDEELLKKELAAYTYDTSRVEIVHAPEVIGNDEIPTKAVRTKKDSSTRYGVSPFKRRQGRRGGFKRRYGRGAYGGRFDARQNQGRFPPRALSENSRFFGARHASLRLRGKSRMQERKPCAFRADGFGVCGSGVRLEERESRSFK